MLGLLGSLIGAGTGLWGAISGNNANKDAINRARNINRYTVFTGKTAKEPAHRNMGLGGALVEMGKGALGGYNMGKSAENLWGQVQNTGSDSIPANTPQVDNAPQVTNNQLPNGVEKVALYADPSKYSPVDAANKQALQGQTMLWNRALWGDPNTAMQRFGGKMSGLGYNPYRR